MNLPNKLTLLRILLVPVFVLMTYLDLGGAEVYIAVGIFVVASVTDWLDGYIARKYNLVTTFGKYMDPLADKILVAAALIYLVEVDIIFGWVLTIIITREFLISGIRLIASDKGIVLAASIWGKSKTFVTMVTIIVVMLNFDYPFSNLVNQILIYASMILTVLSMVDYTWKNKNIFND